MPLLADQSVDVTGHDYRVKLKSDVPSGVSPPSVLVAALQPQMLQLAGEIADGTALGAAGPRYIETIVLPRITKPAHAAGRSAPRVAALFPIAVTKDCDGARWQPRRCTRATKGGRRTVHCSTTKASKPWAISR